MIATDDNGSRDFAARYQIVDGQAGILVESARRRRSLKRGGGAQHMELQESRVFQPLPSDEMLAVDEALDLLAAKDPTAADLVKLKYFVGMTMEESAAALGLPLRNAERIWTYARAWLRRKMAGDVK
jgi:RNA polymerase sigma factor (TIGR02999 family)